MKDFSAGKKANGARVVQLRLVQLWLDEVDFSKLMFCAQAAEVAPETLIAMTIRAEYALFTQRIAEDAARRAASPT
jgi:hypothetical protein